MQYLACGNDGTTGVYLTLQNEFLVQRINPNGATSPIGRPMPDPLEALCLFGPEKMRGHELRALAEKAQQAANELLQLA